MLKKLFSTALAVVFFSCTLTNCNTAKNSSGRENILNKISVAAKGTLTVAMDMEMPGFFILGGENYGYQYDLLKNYAEELGVELEIISGKSSSSCAEMISRGEADILTTLTQNLNAGDKENSVEIYNTSFVLLGGKAKALAAKKTDKFSLIPFLEQSRILVSSAFQNTKAYEELLDSLPSSQIYVSARGSIELAEQVEAGDFDFAICEAGESHLATALNGSVVQIYAFSEKISISAVINPGNVEGKEHFSTWLDKFRNSSEYAMLNYLYFEKGIVSQFTGKGVRSGGGKAISAYDKLFKQICEQEGYDWRLICAIAYNESRFQPDIISHAGASGLMQVMPGVARQLGFGGDILEPATNVLLGVKLLRKIEKSLKFDRNTPQQDRTMITLACYNAGIGHVMDARNLASKYGANPDSWSDVSVYLTTKSQFAGEPEVKNGKFDGRETLAFVEGVMNKYLSYCSKVNR